MLPRILLIGFTFAQPFLVNSVVDFVGESKEERSGNIAGGLIGASILVYVGLAVCTAWYKHMTYQVLTMYRGALASLVFKKTLALHPSSIKESAPVTLMSTDVENIVLAGDSLHDLWASFIELPIGIYLLYRHVGVPSLFILVPGVSKSDQCPPRQQLLIIEQSPRAWAVSSHPPWAQLASSGAKPSRSVSGLPQAC